MIAATARVLTIAWLNVSLPVLEIVLGSYHSVYGNRNCLSCGNAVRALSFKLDREGPGPRIGVPDLGPASALIGSLMPRLRQTRSPHFTPGTFLLSVLFMSGACLPNPAPSVGQRICSCHVFERLAISLARLMG
jgi:hypothetical protein